MTKLCADLSAAEPVVHVARKERNCLMCHAHFTSEGPGERVCRRCKATPTWRSGIRLSEPRPSGGGRRHGGSS
jgi:hypothetical protein